MRSCRRLLWTLCLLICGAAGSFTNLSADDPITEEFVLHESLGQTWRNECVRFELTPKQAAHMKAGHPLIGPQGTAIAYQLEQDTNGGPNRIAFAVNLNPFEQLGYRFSENAAKSTTTDLKIAEQAENVELSNALTGI